MLYAKLYIGILEVILSNSPTLIDHKIIFFNDFQNYQLSGNIVHADISDHLPNFLIIDKLAFQYKKLR